MDKPIDPTILPFPTLMSLEAKIHDMVESHLTVGELIQVLESMPSKTPFQFSLKGPMSYRGYYDEVSFEFLPTPSTAGKLLKLAKKANGGTFTGYKGGEFTMSSDTPCWLADYGSVGSPLTMRVLFSLMQGTLE